MAVNQQYERSALTPSSRESMQSGGGGGAEMRGVVIISMPRTDSEGKTLCAAFAVQGQQQQQQQPQQQNVTSVSSSAAVPMRRLRRRRRIRRFSLCAIVVAAAIFLWLRGPTLTTNSEEQEEDEDKQVHVYTLYPKYAPVRTKMVQMRRTLLERDMQRLGRVATNNGNATAVVPIRGNIYPDGYTYIPDAMPCHAFPCLSCSKETNLSFELTELLYFAQAKPMPNCCWLAILTESGNGKMHFSVKSAPAEY
jgi:hypothetical protein